MNKNDEEKKFDIIQTSSSIKESIELLADLDNELNEIMNGSIANHNTLQINANKISSIETITEDPALIELNKEKPNEVYMERLDSIEIELKSTNSNDPNSKILEMDDHSHHRISDDNFSSPFEDSECFFDTIESPTVLLHTNRAITSVDDLLEEKCENESNNKEKIDTKNREEIIETTPSVISVENLTKNDCGLSEKSTHKNDIQIEEIPIEGMQELILIDKSNCSSDSSSF